MKTTSSYRTTFARVHGAGAANGAGAHWLGHQLALLILAPLLIYVVGSFFAMVVFQGGGYDVAVKWVRCPLNAVVLILTLGFAFYHGLGGLHDMVIDYLHGAHKVIATVILKFSALFFTLSGSVAVLKILLGA